MIPTIKRAPHAYKKKNNCRCVGGSARRVFGFNPKVRNQSERSHAEGNVRSDLRWFKAICTAMLIENSLTSWGHEEANLAESGRRVDRPATRVTHARQHGVDIRLKPQICERGLSCFTLANLACNKQEARIA